MEDSRIVNIGIILQVVFQSIVLCLLQSHLRKSENLILVVFVIVTVFMTILMGIIFLIIRYSRNRRAVLEERIRQCQFTAQLSHRYSILENELTAATERLQNSLQREVAETIKLVEELECDQDNYGKRKKMFEIAGGAWNWGYCANAIANIVLSEKVRECEDRQIEIQVDTKIPMGLSLSDYDICSLFSNLLDNAMEACNSLEETRRKININANVQKQNFYLAVENSCTLEYAKRPKRRGHGLGMEIVKKIVEQHQGQMQVKPQEGWYRVEIILPQ